VPSDINNPTSSGSVDRLTLGTEAVRGGSPSVPLPNGVACSCADFEATPLGNGPCCACICPCFETE
jgi:hypothetical protein